MTILRFHPAATDLRSQPAHSPAVNSSVVRRVAVSVATLTRRFFAVLHSMLRWPGDFAAALFGYEEGGIGIVEEIAAERLQRQIAAAFEDYRRTVHGYAPKLVGISIDSDDTAMKVVCLDCDTDRVLYRSRCSKCGGSAWAPKGREIDVRYRRKVSSG